MRCGCWQLAIHHVATALVKQTDGQPDPALNKPHSMLQGRELKKTLQFLRPNTLLEYSKQVW